LILFVKGKEESEMRKREEGQRWERRFLRGANTQYYYRREFGFDQVKCQSLFGVRVLFFVWRFSNVLAMDVITS
jgi:hypothetical protein